MPENPPKLSDLSPEDHTLLAHAVMQRQSALSLRVAFVFIVVVFGLPLVNHFLPEFANQSVGGFTLTWLFLGVLFFPLTWLLSAYFIRESNRIEEQCRDWRTVLGREAGEPLEPQGLGDVRPAFLDDEEDKP
jgi:uncharacterized membrane protein (DUF485 family)